MSAALNKISAFYTEVLFGSDRAAPALEYIRSRGFSDEIIKSFGVGYSPDIRIDYIKHGYLTYTEVDTLVGLHHLFESNTTRYSDRFGGRLVFPVRTPRGAVAGFAARTVKDELPKYLNSSESDSYKKAHALFGLDLAKESIYDADKAIICEGYTDAMAFHQCGIPFAVACGGTYATKHQIAQIARYTDNIYLSFDADSAGDSVTENTYGLVKEMGLNVGKIDIPRGKDPADILLK